MVKWFKDPDRKGYVQKDTGNKDLIIVKCCQGLR